MKRLLKRILCITLICGLVFPYIPVKNVNAIILDRPYTIRIQTDPFLHSSFNSFIPEINEGLLEETVADMTYINQYNKWDKLVNYLHASLLINAGVDVVAVSGDLGHSQVSTTSNIYCHMFQEDRQGRAMQLLRH